MALLDRIRDVNRCIAGRLYFRLYANDVAIGFVDTQLLAALDTQLFHIDKAKKRVDLSFAASERQQFEADLEAFFKHYFEKNQISGWRNERYAVSEKYGSNTLFLIERSALSYLGITGYGVHINGYVRKADGLYMWVAKRSANKPTSPGKLDQIAAGGLPYNVSVWDNVIKECEEEASIPKTLAQQSQPVSAISYWYDLTLGMRPDIIFNYDLCLPEDFVPQVNDDEVESFECYPMTELLEVIANTRQFKFNSAVVVIDFAIRHGLITPKNSDYVALQQGMHQRWQCIDGIR